MEAFNWTIRNWNIDKNKDVGNAESFNWTIRNWNVIHFWGYLHKLILLIEPLGIETGN